MTISTRTSCSVFGAYSGTTWSQQPWSGRHWMVVRILVQVSPIVLATVKQALYAASSQFELDFPVSPPPPESEHPWSTEPRIAKKEIAANLAMLHAMPILSFEDSFSNRSDRLGPCRAKHYHFRLKLWSLHVCQFPIRNDFWDQKQKWTTRCDGYHINHGEIAGRATPF